MKANKIICVCVSAVVFVACGARDTKGHKQGSTLYGAHAIEGVWVHMGAMGPVAFDFKSDGRVEGDFGHDNSVDVVAEWAMAGDTIRFRDLDGQECAGWGTYRVYTTPYYVAFDLIDDMCNGRIKTVMGFWTRPAYKEALQSLTETITRTPDPGLYRTRGRIYLAIGDPEKAKADFNAYITRDSTDARVYVNRAGTRFPHDMVGVVSDCSRAIQLDPSNKNAWFLRGLARYEMGEVDSACSDFARAIALGFEVLREAEQARCADFWDP